MINPSLALKPGVGKPGSGSHVPNRGTWNVAAALAAATAVFIAGGGTIYVKTSSAVDVLTSSGSHITVG